VALLCPAVATAGEVTAGAFTAAPGEKNDVTYEADGRPPWTVVDNGAPLTVGSGCTPGSPVTCTYTSGVTLHLGDRADRGSASAVLSAVVYGDEGADVIHADAESPVVYGGPGADEIQVGGNGLTAYGGRGDDRILGASIPAFSTYFVGEEGDDTLDQRTPASNTYCELDGGPGADRLLGYFCTERGGPGRDIMTRHFDHPAGGPTDGGEGGDIMVGGSGAGSFDGGSGNDFIQAAVNGVADTIVCGPGNDIVRANAADSVAADCENVTRVEPPA
jgi:Ca2+-binding RTX toxin-like protein